ncbi:MAG: MerR family transcriptional regulator [Fimbriimonadaceae bacterium]|nr:MerR family transcriptional regulator [Fimbriimonadaceae bacterium]QYK52963.1 MAG: MerR family transcriptional regulator [Fimbriimonadaceae bacterium]
MSLRRKKSDKGVSISLASQITGVEVHTLRYWEKEFAGYLNPIRTNGGQRRYRAEDIQVVLELRKLLRDEMFSIAGARRHLARYYKEAA